MSPAFAVDAQGFVALPSRLGPVASFLSAGVHVRDYADPARARERLVEIVGVDAEGLESADSDAVVAWLDHAGLIALIEDLGRIADRIVDGEVR